MSDRRVPKWKRDRAAEEAAMQKQLDALAAAEGRGAAAERERIVAWLRRMDAKRKSDCMCADIPAEEGPCGSCWPSAEEDAAAIERGEHRP